MDIRDQIADKILEVLFTLYKDPEYAAVYNYLNLTTDGTVLLSADRAGNLRLLKKLFFYEEERAEATRRILDTLGKSFKVTQYDGYYEVRATMK